MLREQVVQFEDYQVERITMAEMGRYRRRIPHYSLLMVIDGRVDCKGQCLDKEQVLLLTAGTEIEIRSDSSQAVFLFAEPR